MKIRVKYFDEKMPKIQNIEGKSNWFDLRAAETVEMKKGEFRLIPLGVAMELPEGYEAYVIPRSGTFKNFKIIQANSMGLIDNSYSGDNDQWFFPAYALEDTMIEKYDRICQFRIQESMKEIQLEETSFLKNENRGGFSSTGVK